MNIAIYCRTEHRATCTGLASSDILGQRYAISTYFMDHPELSGSTITNYEDADCSGANLERPGLHLLLEDVKARKIDCIITSDLDRICGLASKTILLFYNLSALFPIRLISVNEGFDSASAAGDAYIEVILQSHSMQSAGNHTKGGEETANGE